MKTRIIRYEVKLSDLETLNHPKHMNLREEVIHVTEIDNYGDGRNSLQWIGEIEVESIPMYFSKEGWGKFKGNLIMRNECFKTAEECFKALKNGVAIRKRIIVND